MLQHPTGRYESSIQTSIQSDSNLVTDGGMVYGPWLAGTSSRNDRSRFKGYQHWRRATQRLQERSSEIVDKTLSDLVQRLGG